MKNIDFNAPIIFLDDASKNSWTEKRVANANFREANIVFDFAHRWAAAMQHYIAEGKKIPEIALRAASEADNENNIGHPQVICALTALVDHWKYGKELKNWHFEEVSKPKRIAYPLQAATL